ncbi:MAG: single-stranded-DNA-specific exonuclease RecJ [Planctomycetes bacterium]|nr:single-stranded-DNA-specific exonuclease RecJ [Planctomycetota bacterium]
MSKRWLISHPAPGCTDAAARWRVPPIIAQLLINRGVAADQSSASFLSPQLKDLHPPRLLPGAEQAAPLLAAAARARTRIVLYGDYDVDGITGVALLWRLLRAAGAEVTFYVPHRVEEGYGLNLEAVRRLIREGAGLIVTIDCGVTAVEVAEAVRQAGVKLIITDHHAPRETLPEADAIVHPAIREGYPNPDLSGAGVAFKLAWAVAQELCGAERVTPELRSVLLDLLPLVALGTIADVVALRGENRILARHGLAAVPDSPLPGLAALIESAGLTGEKISGYDVGFKLAPRLNAAGRMGHARLAVELFTSADAARAREIALYLEEHNRSRQSVERKILRQAREIVERDHLANDARRALVLACAGWHPGVIGIVAARLAEQYHRPAVLIALAGGEGQGSARSIAPFDLAAALADCAEHLISYGGHAMAAGLKVATPRVPAFAEAFVQIANQRLTGEDLLPKLRLDAEVTLEQLDLPTTQAILDLGPFGVGNPRPRLATDWVELAAEPRCVGKGSDHLQAAFQHHGVCIRGIGFGLGGHLEDLKHHRRCRVAFEPTINAFNGRRSVEMQIIDLQFPP